MSAAFQLFGGHPAVDFVNTLDNRFVPEGPNELIQSFPDLVRFATETGLLTSAQARSLSNDASADRARRALRSAIALRESLAQIFYATALGREVPQPAVSQLNQNLEDALQHRRLKQHNGDFEWIWQDIDSNPEAVRWLLAGSAVDLLTSPQAGKIRECGNERCRWLFLDTSKNNSRRWCDMSLCGNRLKARRYYSRHHTAGR